MSQVESEINQAVQKIIDLNSQDEYSYKRMLGLGKSMPSQGQFVLTGFQFGSRPEKMVGFCVQIRKGCGQFGSDMVFLRHASGLLVTHENQSFYALTSEQESIARSVFESLPEEEDYTHGYSCCEKIYEKGFIIENSQSSGTPNTPFTIRIDKGDGTTEINTFI